MKQLDIIAVIIAIPVPMGTWALILFSLPVDANHSIRCLTQLPEYKSKLACTKEHQSDSSKSPRDKSLGENFVLFLHSASSSLTVNSIICLIYTYSHYNILIFPVCIHICLSFSLPILSVCLGLFFLIKHGYVRFWRWLSNLSKEKDAKK